MKDETTERQDVYIRITNNIVSQLEQGVRPWIKPWQAEHAAGRITRPLRHDGTPYRGINVLSLWCEAMARDFIAPIWMTYRQAQELGGQVRKGEKGSPVVYTNTYVKPDTDAATGDEAESAIRFLKGYTVFNVEQIDNLPPHYLELAEPEPRLETPSRIARAEGFFAATGASIAHGGNRAFYRRSTDAIQMPPFEAFRDAESYYATLAHECVHWTGHEARLAREFGSRRFGSEGYAMEELVAELGAAFVCADLDISVPSGDADDAGAAHLAQHASYIANWLKVLKHDSRAVFSAASHAQRGADFLRGRSPVPIARTAAAQAEGRASAVR